MKTASDVAHKLATKYARGTWWVGPPHHQPPRPPPHRRANRTRGMVRSLPDSLRRVPQQ